MPGQKEAREFSIGLGEILSSIPHIFGIRGEEGPVYEVLARKENFEVRIYNSYIVAETEVIASSYKEGTHTAFNRLANYIFGKNSNSAKMAKNSQVLQEQTLDGERMAMTSPVLLEKTNFGWKMSFIVPSKYSIQTVPMPIDSEVKLREVPIRTMAVLTYTGLTNQNKIDEKTAELTSALQEDGNYQIVSTATAAQYDPPATIPFLRRNEILVEVEKVH